MRDGNRKARSREISTVLREVVDDIAEASLRTYDGAYVLIEHLEKIPNGVRCTLGWGGEHDCFAVIDEQHWEGLRMSLQLFDRTHYHSSRHVTFPLGLTDPVDVAELRAKIEKIFRDRYRGHVAEKFAYRAAKVAEAETSAILGVRHADEYEDRVGRYDIIVTVDVGSGEGDQPEVSEIRYDVKSSLEGALKSLDLEKNVAMLIVPRQTFIRELRPVALRRLANRIRRDAEKLCGQRRA